MKKFAKIALVALMTLCMTLTTVANVGAEEPTPKEKASFLIESGEGKAGIVATEDYVVKAYVDGAKVNASNVSVTVSLTDVGGLGVEGTKSKTWNLSTGSSMGEVGLTVVHNAVSVFTKANVKATVEGLPFEYDVVNSTNGKTNYSEVTATPKDEEAVRKAWLEFASHIDTTVVANDSNAVLLKGSYVVLGKETLSLVKDFTVDNVTPNQEYEDKIREAVELKYDETSTFKGIKVYVPAGTSLTVGDDKALLLDDTMITVEGIDLSDALYGELLQSCTTVDRLLTTLIGIFGDAIIRVNEKDITVDVDFTCVHANHTIETINAKEVACLEDGYTGDKFCTGCETIIEEGTVIAAEGHKFVNLKCACGAEIIVNADTHEDSITEEEAEKVEVKDVTIVDDHKTDGAVATVKKEATDMVITLLSDPDAAEELVEAGVITEEVAAAIIEAVEAGESVDAIITVTEITSVSKETEANIETAAEKALGNKDVKVEYLDVKIELFVDGDSIGEFHKLSKPITVTVALPEELVVEGAKYVVIRDHEGTVTALTTVDNGDGTISFTTDQFSTYAIAYTTPKAPETGDSGLAGLYAMLFALSAAALFLLKRQEA